MEHLCSIELQRHDNSIMAANLNFLNCLNGKKMLNR